MQTQPSATEVEWYRTADLFLQKTPVIWRMPDGRELPGTLRLTDSGLRRAVFREGRTRVELKPPHVPAYWRPADPETWPLMLPDPVTPPRPIDRAAREAEIEPDEWPYQGLELGGAGQLPQSVLETEARILRAIRTARHFDRLEAREGDRPDILWPSGLRQESAEIRDLLRREAAGDLATMAPEDRRRLGRLRETDRDDFHVQATGSGARLEWRPTPRDVSDYEAANCPLRWVSDDWRGVMIWRAALPPYSWASVAYLLGSREAAVRREHEAQMADAMIEARRQRVRWR